MEKSVILLLLVFTLTFNPIYFSWSAQLIRNPLLDNEGRFWIYKEKEDFFPFIPGGWMPVESAQMIKVFDLGWQNNPYDGKTCIAVVIEWKPPWWCGVAWMTLEKDDKGNQWWGDNDEGFVFNLSGSKRLVFFLKGKSGRERIQIKSGILSDKPFGDNITKDGKKVETPIESEWLTLTTQWKKYTIDLKNYQLLKIANGFTFVSSKQQQVDNSISQSFFIDNIYYSWSDQDKESLKSIVSPENDLVTIWGKIKSDF